MSGELQAIDKRILDVIQSNFPLTSRPYAEIGQQETLVESKESSKLGATGTVTLGMGTDASRIIR